MIGHETVGPHLDSGLATPAQPANPDKPPRRRPQKRSPLDDSRAA
jgi:hypothetical protein